MKTTTLTVERQGFGRTKRAASSSTLSGPILRWGLSALLLAIGSNSIFANENEGTHGQDASGRTMSARVDALIAERWAAEEVAPAPMSDDARFMRRVYLDLTGVTPPVAEARRFLGDAGDDKRARLIDSLLSSPRHSTHLANLWRNLLLPNGFRPDELGNAMGLQSWLQQQFADNLRYDSLVAEFLMASGSLENGPGLFYTSLELKPEELAGQTAQIFLGVRMQCAQCHNHPFDSWTQRDFWGYAAFFAQLEDRNAMQSRNGRSLQDSNRGEVTLPDSDEVIAPKYPGSRMADPAEGGTRRMQLAIWMASRDNPYLAKAAVNRVWSQLFGRGIVEPVDDLGPGNPASHPELLDELAKFFAHSGFDLQQLYRVLVNTNTYQLSSMAGEQTDLPSRDLFAYYAPRPLSAEQMYDSLERTVGTQTLQDNNVAVPPALRDTRRLQFVMSMQQITRGTKYELGPIQALSLMNGSLTATATHPQQGTLLQALEAPFFSDQQCIDVLFLSTLSRYPNKEESSEFASYLQTAADPTDPVVAADSGGDPIDGTKRHVTERGERLADLLWMLINSAEFALIP
ncbi:MAG: DUF1549 and DUF1553 domain-containing protein [Pirellulaceae bacterium]